MRLTGTKLPSHLTTGNVRFRENSERELLAASLSAHDPKQTLVVMVIPDPVSKISRTTHSIVTGGPRESSIQITSS
jgi:hypothetical protein